VIEPPFWTAEQLELDRLEAIENFRKVRLEEPLDDYLRAFDQYHKSVEELLVSTMDLSALESTGFNFVTNKRMLETFRYLTAPPVSEDDLSVVADIASFSRKQMLESPERVARLIQVVRSILDRRRFPWVIENRQPTAAERGTAIIASASLMAARRVETNRRTLGKRQQEEIVKKALKDRGFQELPARSIPNVSHAPELGAFCGESMLGTRKGDIIVRLWDFRVMPIECKVSNSYLNSVKRLNNDAAVKAVSWKRDFGLRQVVPSAILGGVYKLKSLLDAQERGLTLFWSHNLKPLTEWIEKTRE